MSNETPRTEVAIELTEQYRHGEFANFARQLETELTAAINTKDMLWGQLQESRRQVEAAIQRANQYKSIAQEADAKAFNLVSKVERLEQGIITNPDGRVTMLHSTWMDQVRENEKLAARVSELEGALKQIQEFPWKLGSIEKCYGDVKLIAAKAITARTEGEG